jgi:glutamyl-tRNA synthetase
MEANKVENKKTEKKDNKEKNTTSGAQFNVLPNAEMGNVVTRFPPEPSGYLHIGHVKAAMLNYHYSKMYNGKMILRFDDTNPAKEKGEYVENIKKDLATLEIYPDRVTHTSDYFDQLHDIMTQMIKEGKCYLDNTPVDQMRKERMDGTPSKCRDQTPEENLKLWEAMGSENPSTEIRQYCVRGKIDYKHANKCLRDPVFYRFSDEVHHRVGAKYKIFPTYDFACPIVDSIEGVTHCLRANEYSDRIPMYKWVIKSGNFRDVNIYEFSRLNLVHTVLSKRTLKWFVENNLVEGWYDPRFPTVQGILRRGLKVQTLKEFMLAQGPSKNTNCMEWDKIYASNKDIFDPTAKRLFAVSNEKNVKVCIENQPQVEEVLIDWFQKNKEMGQRKQMRNSEVIIEYEDAKEVVEGMKFTLKNWGNSIVTKIVKEGELIKEIHIRMTPEDQNFKNTKIVHWVPIGEKQVNIILKLVR